MAQGVSDDVFARAALQMGAITPEQLQAAQSSLVELVRQGQTTSLGEMLVRQGIITQPLRENIERKVRAQAPAAARQLGPYKLLRKLGEGGMGAVYLAEDTLLNRKVALKVLPQKYSTEHEFLSRFKREAVAAGKLNHRNIVGAYAVGDEGGWHYYAMEYCEGTPLDKTITRLGQMPVADALRIVEQVARGLDYAHRNGVIHRDVKPSNIIVLPDGTAKILDLGLSKNTGASEQSFQTVSGTALGTPHYISPEQARGESGVDGRSDIYSLGATLYHLVTGKTPYEGTTPAMVMMKHMTAQVPDPRDHNSDLSDEVVHIICKAMAKAPDDRYANCEEMAKDLELVQQCKAPQSKAIDATRSTVAVRPRRRPPGRPAEARRHEQEHPAPPAGASEARKRNQMILAGVGVGALLLVVIVVAMRSCGEPAAVDTKRVAVTPPTTPELPPQLPPPARKPADKAEPPKSDPPPTNVPPSKRDLPPVLVDWAEAFDLLKRTDPLKDKVAGEWEFSDGGLVARSGDDAKLRLPYHPAEEYDFLIEFTRQTGSECVMQSLTAAGRQFRWRMGGWANTVFGFGRIKDVDADQNPTCVRRDRCIVNGTRHTSIVKVRKDSVEAWFDGQRICAWKTDYQDMSLIKVNWELGDTRALGLACQFSQTVFHRVLVREVTGKGHFTRE